MISTSIPFRLFLISVFAFSIPIGCTGRKRENLRLDYELRMVAFDFLINKVAVEQLDPPKVFLVNDSEEVVRQASVRFGRKCFRFAGGRVVWEDIHREYGESTAIISVEIPEGFSDVCVVLANISIGKWAFEQYRLRLIRVGGKWEIESFSLHRAS